MPTLLPGVAPAEDRLEARRPSRPGPAPPPARGFDNRSVRYLRALLLLVRQLWMIVDEPDGVAHQRLVPRDGGRAARHLLVVSSGVSFGPRRRPANRVDQRASHEGLHQRVLVVVAAVGVADRLRGIGRGTPALRRAPSPSMAAAGVRLSRGPPARAPARHPPSRRPRAHRVIRPSSTCTQALTVAAGRSWKAKRRWAMAAPWPHGGTAIAHSSSPGSQRRLVRTQHELVDGQRAPLASRAQLDARSGRQQERGRIGMGVGEGQVAAERAGAAHPHVGDAALHLHEVGPASLHQRRAFDRPDA